MSYCTTILIFSLLFIRGSVGDTNLKVSENNGSSVFVELLRGRDGLTGRDGVQGPPGPSGKDGSRPKSGGAIYTRWGKSTCPLKQDTELVYSGITGGTKYNQGGGGANHLCMPKDPDYSPDLRYQSGVLSYGSAIYGAEYEFPLVGPHDYDIPCAVCYVSTRPTVIMIPAKASCPPSWTREYYGYIMAEHKARDRGRSMFECVDKDQDGIPGIHSPHNNNGAVLYHVEAVCVSLLCPPYDPHKELNCVVCTK